MLTAQTSSTPTTRYLGTCRQSRTLHRINITTLEGAIELADSIWKIKTKETYGDFRRIIFYEAGLSSVVIEVMEQLRELLMNSADRQQTILELKRLLSFSSYYQKYICRRLPLIPSRHIVKRIDCCCCALKYFDVISRDFSLETSQLLGVSVYPTLEQLYAPFPGLPLRSVLAIHFRSAVIHLWRAINIHRMITEECKAKGIENAHY